MAEEVADLPVRMREVVEEVRQACIPQLETVTGEARADLERLLGIGLEPEPLRGYVDSLLVEAGMPSEADHTENPNVVSSMAGDFRGRLIKSLNRTVREEIDAICGNHSPGEDRQIALRQLLTHCLDEGFEVFWGVLEVLDRSPLQVETADPIDFLQRNEDLFLAFVQTVQGHSSLQEWRLRIERSVVSRSYFLNLSFKGASVPMERPLFKVFGQACGELRKQTYLFLIAALDSIAAEATDGLQRAYLSSEGASNTWLSLINYLRHRANVRVYSTTGAYLPMIPHDQRESENFVIVEDHDDTTLIAFLIAAIQARAGEDARPIVFLPTVFRTGQRLDIPRIMQEVQAACPSPKVLFALDAAQDHYFYPDADIVIYSKRFGDSGMGMLMLREDLPPEMGLSDHACVKGGLNIEHLARMVAAWRCERQPVHVASRVQDLRRVASLWHFSGRGTYIDRQASAISQYFEQDSVLKAHFEVEFSSEPEDLPGNLHPWKSSRILVLRRRKSSNLDLLALNERLVALGIEVDCFSLGSLRSFRHLRNLAKDRYSPQKARKLFEAIFNFQNTTDSSQLLEMVSLPKVYNGGEPTRDLYLRQRAALKAAAERQTLFRVHIDVTHTEEDIHEFLGRFSRATAAQLAP